MKKLITLLTLIFINPLSAMENQHSSSNNNNDTAASSAATSTKSTRLIQAIISGNLPDVEALLKTGVNVNATSAHYLYSGKTPLHYAAEKRNHHVVQALLNAGANVNDTDADSGQTPLHKAALWQHPLTVEALLKAGANVSAKDNEGLTALDIALEANRWHREIIALLQEAQGVRVRFVQI